MKFQKYRLILAGAIEEECCSFPSAVGFFTSFIFLGSRTASIFRGDTSSSLGGILEIHFTRLRLKAKLPHLPRAARSQHSICCFQKAPPPPVFPFYFQLDDIWNFEKQLVCLTVFSSLSWWCFPEKILFNVLCVKMCLGIQSSKREKYRLLETYASKESGGMGNKVKNGPMGCWNRN